MDVQRDGWMMCMLHFSRLPQWDRAAFARFPTMSVMMQQATLGLGCGCHPIQNHHIIAQLGKLGNRLRCLRTTVFRDLLLQ